MGASSAIKRQRKRRRVDTDGDPEFQVAPMVDVLLVLMLFFMAITSTEVLKKNKNLQLVDTKHAKPPEDQNHKHEIIVNVEWVGKDSSARFSVDERTYPTADSLTPVLAGLQQKDPLAKVIIRADKDVEYSNISDLMSACGAAGIGTVSFAVLIGGGNNAKAPAKGGTASN